MLRELVESIDSTSPGAEIDALATALADERRRRVLRYFRQTRETVASVDELAEHLAASENATEPRDRLAVRLHHITLPKLADLGIVEYDARSHTVRYRTTPRTELLSELLDDLDSSEGGG